MKVSQLFENDQNHRIAAEFERILGLKADAQVGLQDKRSDASPQGFYEGVQSCRVFVWLPYPMNYDDLDFFAIMFKKTFKKLLPDYSEFYTDRPAFYNSAGEGNWVYGFKPGEWEEKMQAKLAKRKAGTGCGLEYGVRIPKEAV